MKRTFQKLLFVLLALVLLLAGCYGLLVIHDNLYNSRLANVVQQGLSTDKGIRRYAADKLTRKYLRKKKITKVEISSDNQGSGNILYFASKINHRYYMITFKDRGFGKTPLLKTIQDAAEMPE
ncbi:hypothetical protein [Lactobacillus sp. ESL0681]|uniref:hypothetical protein n=1 Tax=Lactobacillus sp. ESL0681 TaxID=2983211 RepID=UPI0023F72637|nr:hypothetical protein [Lactobacillus sp. ESL0681]WEV39874.1 hypothetical protein OZX59_06595 [Lactobacillus sp. ESL0681]